MFPSPRISSLYDAIGLFQHRAYERIVGVVVSERTAVVITQNNSNCCWRLSSRVKRLVLCAESRLTV